MPNLLLLGLGFISAVLITGTAYLLLRVTDRDVRLMERVSAAQGTWTGPQLEGDVPVKGLGGDLKGAVGGLGRAIMSSGLLPGKTRVELEQTLMGAGFRGPNALALFIGSKLILLAIFPVIGWLLSNAFGLANLTRIAVVLAVTVIGLLAPDFAVRRIRKKYLNEVEDGLPDALDLLTICAQAGLSLEPGMTRVAYELRLSRPAIAREFEMTVRELEILSDSAVALGNMGKRTGLDSLKRLTTTLVQTMQYGTPLSEALRSLSNEMRTMALIRFEERAARLPVLLTLPMILFILPCIFMIVGGPAGISVARSMSK